MKDKIGLFFHPRTKVDGMNKVLWNLTKGLNELGIEYSENTLEKYNGCLQGGVPNYYRLPKDTLMGVSLMEIPTNDTRIWCIYNRFVTCSDWVKEKYKQFPTQTQGKQISVWASGIDTERFNDNDRNITQDCFIYYKTVTNHVNSNDLIRVSNELAKRNLTFSVIEYGKYTEEQLIATAKRSRFCVLLTGTESQGIAQMEIMSMGCPLYVFDQKIWRRERRQPFTFREATSAPFFNKECGEIVEGIDFLMLDTFIHNLPSYHPREYIEAAFTLKKCAQRYNDIIKGRVM